MLRKSLRIVLLGFRKVLHSLPDSWRKRLRGQHALMSLYAGALHSSRLFYGTLSEKQLQQRYDKLIPQQTAALEAINKALPVDARVNILLLVLDETMLHNTLDSLQGAARVDTVFLISKDKCRLPDTSCLTFRLKVLNHADELGGNLPLLVLRSGERLHPLAAAAFIDSAQQSGQSQIIVSCDTDYMDDNGLRRSPECYPEWNPDLQLSTGYINTGIGVFGDEIQQGLASWLFNRTTPMSVALWLTHQHINSKLNFKHCALTLVHKMQSEDEPWFQSLQSVDERHSWPVSLTESKFEGNAVVQWNQNTQPLVSIIIPTRNGKDLVSTCISSIVDKTTYCNYEILLIDNQSDEQASIDYFSELADKHECLRLVPYPKEFNYSAINNFAVEQAKGELLAFVNNDIEVITPEWLQLMTNHALRPDIGCVGAKLYYPNKRVQHAGVVLGYGGGAGHAHKFFPDYHPGYLNRLGCTNAFSAVTAACLVIRRETFERVGGFNKAHLAVAFNDVDLCLKVAEEGLRNLYCAEAELFHYESISRGTENTPEKRARFERELDYLQTHWRDYIDADPAYNPNLTLRRENFALRE